MDLSGYFNTISLDGALFPYEYFDAVGTWNDWWETVPAHIRNADGLAGHRLCNNPENTCIERSVVEEFADREETQDTMRELLNGDRIYGIFGNAIFFPAGGMSM